MTIANFSQLQVAAPLTGAEIVPLMQSGTTVQSTLAQIKAAVGVFPSGDASGVTDYNNIIAAFAKMLNPATNALIFAPGQYYINQKLVFTFTLGNQSQFAFLCLGGWAFIQQVTSNTGCLEFQVPATGTPNNIRIEGLAFTYSTQQTSANTSSVCLGVRGVSAPTPNATTFEWVIARCGFYNAYRGIANTQPAGQFPWWGIQVSGDCFFNNLSGAAFRDVSPTSVGQPNIWIGPCIYQAPYLGGSEAIWQIDGCDSLTFVNVENLSVVGQTIALITSSYFTIINMKAEVYTTANGIAFVSTQNSTGTVVSLNMEGVVATNGTEGFCLICQNGQAGQGVTVDNITMNVTSGTGTVTLFGSNPINLNVLSPPTIGALGTGPAVVRLQNSGGSANSNFLHLVGPQGAEMSDDIGDASLTWVGFNPAANSSGTARVNIWNSPLTTNRSITMNGTNGTAAADNLWDGAEATFIRTVNATGASTLTWNGAIPASKVIPISGWLKCKWRRSLGWVEVGSGAL